MKIETITERVIQKADRELTERIQQAAKPLDSLLRDGSRGDEIPIIRKNSHDDGSKEIGRAYWLEMLEALKRNAFEKNRDRNRQTNLDDFMKKVDRLGDEIDALRAEVLP